MNFSSSRRQSAGMITGYSALKVACLISATISASSLFSISQVFAGAPSLPEGQLAPSAVSTPFDRKADVIPLLAAAETDAKSVTDNFDKNTILLGVAETKSEAGDIIGAQSTIKGLSNDFHKAIALSELAVAQARKGKFARAKATIDSIPMGPAAPLGDLLKGLAWGGIASAQIKAGDIAGARGSMDQAKIAARDGGSPYNVVMMRVACAQVKAGDLAEAVDTASTANLDVPARLFVLGKVAIAKFRLGDTVAVRQILEQMERIGRDTDQKTLEPIDRLHLAVAQANAGDLTGAKATADSISGDYPFLRVITWSCIAIAQAKTGDLVAAQRTIEKAKVAATGIRDAMSKKESSLHLAIAQIKCGDLTGAETTASMSDDSEVKISVWNSIAMAQADAGAFAKARQSLQRARVEAEAIADVRGKAWVMPGIASAYDKIDGLAAARKWIDRLSYPSARSRCYIQLAKDRLNEGIEAFGDEDE